MADSNRGGRGSQPNPMRRLPGCQPRPAPTRGWHCSSVIPGSICRRMVWGWVHREPAVGAATKRGLHTREKSPQAISGEEAVAEDLCGHLGGPVCLHAMSEARYTDATRSDEGVRVRLSGKYRIRQIDPRPGARGSQFVRRRLGQLRCSGMAALVRGDEMIHLCAVVHKEA